MTLRQRALTQGLMLICLFALFGQLTMAMPRLSTTYDEPIYTAIGYADLTVGDFTWHGVIGHGPLANLLSAWPLLLGSNRVDMTQLPSWGGDSSLGIGRELLASLGPIETTLFATRLPMAWLTLLLAAIVARWAEDAGGKAGGLIALAIFAFEPDLIAHGQLNTTDMSVTAFGFLGAYLLARYLRQPSAAAFVGTGIALGAAVASKASGLFWVGAYGLISAAYWLTSIRRSNVRTLVAWGVRLAGLYLIALLTLWTCYGFEYGPIGPDGVSLPAPSHWRGMTYQQSNLTEGQNTFIAGSLHQGGHWSYFLLTSILKTPLPVLIGLLFSIYAILRRRLEPRQHIVPLTIAPTAYFVISMLAALNIGHRHLLPILPFIVTLIAQTIGSELLPTLRSSAWRKSVAFTVAAWYIIGTLSVFPHYLTYFNELAGGPDGGYRYLADSSIDWGQGFYELADYLAGQWQQEGHAARPVQLAAFSSIDPSWYGIAYTPIPPTTDAPVALPSRFRPGLGTYIISVIPLQGIWTLDPDTYDWFRHQTPVARVAHVLNVYEVTTAPQTIERVIQCATPPLPLDVAALADGFGPAFDSNTTTLSSFNCRESWLYPGTGGWLVMPGSTQEDTWTEQRLSGVTVAFAQREHWSHPASTLYELPKSPQGAVPPQTAIHVAAPEQQPPQVLAASPPVDSPLETSGPLTFLGYDTATSDTEITLDTFWRVETITDQPLSLMAHLVNENGVPVTVADGLGVSIENWMPGDVIVQHHRFQLPDTAERPLYLVTGGYRLDTMERWGIYHTGDGVGDSIVIDANIE